MFFSSGISGSDLPDKTICLTFDDGPGSTEHEGPGPRTLELARFLYERNIPASFFVLGEFAQPCVPLLEQVAALGHLIVNHTFSHADLLYGSAQAAATSIMATDSLIEPLRLHAADFTHPDVLAEPAKQDAFGRRIHSAHEYGYQLPPKLFRPPYGGWNSKIAGELNWTEAANHIGPIMWDIDGQDWSFWRNGQSPEECSRVYIELIRRVRRGIVLMHDSSFEEDIRVKSYTFRLVQLLVDWLVADGYTFTRLDHLPQVKHAARINSVISLQTVRGQYIAPKNGGGSAVVASSTSIGPWEPLGVVELGDDHVALRCLSGHYISQQSDGGNGILANRRMIGKWEVFKRVKLRDGKIALRCRSGHYLSAQHGGGGELLANATAIGECEQLAVHAISATQ